MIKLRYFAALALFAPAMASAQAARPRPAGPPVNVEIVATAQLDAPASSLTMTLTYSATGDTAEAAEKAKTEKYAEILKALQQEGVAASALTALADDDPARMAMTLPSIDVTPELDAEMAASVDRVEAAADDTETTTVVEPVAVKPRVMDVMSLRLNSMGQLKAVSEALTPLDVQLGAPTAELENPEAVQRQVKAKALRTARADADAYATELGLRVLRVARISEAGNNLLLPGMQDMVQQLTTAGPKAMSKMFESKPGTIRVAETIIVEFVLAP